MQNILERKYAIELKKTTTFILKIFLYILEVSKLLL